MEVIVNPNVMPPFAKTALADIETTAITYDRRNLMVIPHTVHMLVANDYERDIYYVWVGHEEIEKGTRWLETCDTVIFHFGRGFDEKVLKHHFKLNKRTKPGAKWYDSVILLRMLYSNQTDDDKIHVRQWKDSKQPKTNLTFTGNLVGKHSLEAWGLRIGIPKDDYTATFALKNGKKADPWAQYGPEMHEYGVRDVKVLRYIWQKKILPLLKDTRDDLTRAIPIEHWMESLMQQLKQTGIKFNVEGALRMAEQLEIRSEQMVGQLQQDFPPRLEPVKWDYAPINEKERALPPEFAAEVALLRDKLVAIEELARRPGTEGEADAARQAFYRIEERIRGFYAQGSAHNLTGLMKQHPKNKAYRPYFNLPIGYQREMWGQVFFPKVNRTILDKVTGEVKMVVTKYVPMLDANGNPILPPDTKPRKAKKPVALLEAPTEDASDDGEEAALDAVEPEIEEEEAVVTLAKVPTCAGELMGDNAFVKCAFKEFNPRSRPQIVRRLLEMGWEPDEFTEAGNPVTDDAHLQKIEDQLSQFKGAANLAKYLTIEKRIGAIKTGKKAWLKLVDPDGFLHPTIIPCSAVTMRATHSDPNVSQVPAVKMVFLLDADGKPVMKKDKYGKDEPVLILGKGEAGKWGWDCRALFTVPEGFTMVGVDLAGIELRCWAHYQWPYDDGALAHMILHDDIHESNRKILNFNDRTTAKRWLFAMLYGGGDEQLGWIIDPLASIPLQIKLGRESKRRFMSGVRGFDLMKSNLELSVKRRGWLRGIDGRRVPIRKPHAALNTQLQSCGAIISKYWIRNAINAIEGQLGLKWGYENDYSLLLYSHDEIQLAVRHEHVRRVQDVCLNAAVMAGEQLGMRLPIKADSKAGRHWGDTH